MSFINFDNPLDTQLLAVNNLPLSTFRKVLSTVKEINNSYYQLSDTHKLFYRILSTSDGLITKDPDFRFMPPADQQEWLKLRHLKIGDRGNANSQLIGEIQKVLPGIYNALIEPHISSEGQNSMAETLTLSDQIDTLLLMSSLPSYLEYLEKLTDNKKGVFSQLRRGYISYLQSRGIHLISQFLKTFENDLTILEGALLSDSQLQALPRMGEMLSMMCDRADPHHHDPISLHGINCLRSIYISIFNIAMLLLRSGKQVPIELHQLLPIIPDKIDFTRKSLEEDDAWTRYHDHHFLFMRLPKGQRTTHMECLSTLKPSQRLMWMGCLGKEEIRTLIKPIISRGSHFEVLAGACRSIPPTDEDTKPFRDRIWEVLGELYVGNLMRQRTTSRHMHTLFIQVARSSAAIAPEQANISVIRKLSFLVVDDSERIRQMTVKVLKDAGIKRIATAPNGAVAWKFLQKYSVDVILCDWIMPELSGIELVQKMMQVERLALKTTFLMLTTVNSKAAIVEALSVGVRGFLIKPFTRKQLLEKVYFSTEWLRKEQQSKPVKAKKP